MSRHDAISSGRRRRRRPRWRPGRCSWSRSLRRLPRRRADAAALEIANEALNAARKAGASYADARIGRYRRQSIATRERQVTGVSDSESYGLGVRTLVDGSWGFAATSTMTRAGAQRAAARRRRDVAGRAHRAKAHASSSRR